MGNGKIIDPFGAHKSAGSQALERVMKLEAIVQAMRSAILETLWGVADGTEDMREKIKGLDGRVSALESRKEGKDANGA